MKKTKSSKKIVLKITMSMTSLCRRVRAAGKLSDVPLHKCKTQCGNYPRSLVDDPQDGVYMTAKWCV